jgi:hypothetical protein
MRPKAIGAIRRVVEVSKRSSIIAGSGLLGGLDRAAFA